ncbi:MAG: hypothetical protein WC285_01220 [Candidatus Gracilibacteria bacterium]|jgi:antitoxin component of RelBE/YafQ-DinJ toxin-antitoxin module
MSQSAQFIIRIDRDLKLEAQKKAKSLGIGLGTLTKLFIQAFTRKSEIVFYVGDKTFEEKLTQLLQNPNVSKALNKLGNSV